MGLQVCQFGRYGPCLGGLGPEEETCNGLDDDCDGGTDEGEEGGMLECGDNDGDCGHMDGFVLQNAQTCALRIYRPGARECGANGVCPAPLCEEFDEQVTEECGECTSMSGCDGPDPGVCEPEAVGTPCSDGGSCDGAGRCVTPGCADGTREGFEDAASFPTIASCAGDWPGRQSLRSPRSGEACGDDLGDCATPADLCAPGWHVCMVQGNAEDLHGRVSDVVCDSELAGEGVFVAASSHCSVRDACGYHEPLPCWGRGYCSEAVCCGTGCGLGGCTDAVWEGTTSIAPDINRGCGRAGNNVHGVLCCMD